MTDMHKQEYLKTGKKKKVKLTIKQKINYFKDQVKKIFPPDKLTNQYIDIIRLRPKISDSILGEKINLKAKASILTAKDDCSYIVASTCCFFNTKDDVVIDQKWKEKEKELKEKQKNDP